MGPLWHGPEAWDAELQILEGNRHPGHQSCDCICHDHLQGCQSDAQKVHPAFPVRIHLAPEARQGWDIALGGIHRIAESGA